MSLFYLLMKKGKLIIMSRENIIKVFAGVFAVSAIVAGCGRDNFIEPQNTQTTLIAENETANNTVINRKPVKEAPVKPAAVQSASGIDAKTELAGITADTTFGEAIEAIRNSANPPLNIVVQWNDLRDRAGIDRQTPVGTDMIHGISLRKNLEIILQSLSTRQAKLDYTIVDGVIVIATKETLPVKTQTRTYDTTDLSSRPADYYSQPATGSGNTGR